MVYETTYFRSHLDRWRTPATPGRVALGRWLYPAPLPNPAGQCLRAKAAVDRPQLGLYRPVRPQRHPRLPGRGPGLSPREVLPPHQRPAAVGCRLRRQPPRPAAPQPPDLRPAPQQLDPGAGGPGLPRARLDPTAPQHRSPALGHPAPGRLLAAGQTLDHQPRPRLRAEEACPRPPAPAGRVPSRLGAGLPGRVLVVAPGPAEPARLGGRGAL